MTIRTQVIWTALVFLAVSVIVVGVRPLVPPDEVRYGIIAAEMAETGQWFSLRMAGFHYYEKPPLGMWLMAASMQVFGENAVALRLPSVLATCVTAVVAGWLAVRITARREIGLAASLVQSTTLGPLVLGSVASLDPIFSAFVALALGACFGASTSAGRAQFKWLALAGLSAALAFLTKGVLGLAVPAGTVLAFLLWERRYSDLWRFAWVPSLAAVLAIGPVALAIHRSEPRFWESFIMIEHVRRFSSPDANQHTQPWWYLIALFPVGGVFWALLWPRVIGSLGQARSQSTGALTPGMRYCICWIVVPLVALSLSSGKVATYVLPLYAPLAVLVTVAIFSAHASGKLVAGVPERIGRALLRTLAACALVLAVVGGEAFGFTPLWSTHATLRWIALSAALLVWAQLDVHSWRASSAALWVTRMATAPVAVLMMIPFLYPDAFVRQSQLPWTALEDHSRSLGEARTLVTTAQLGHCVSWVTHRRDIVIAGAPGEFDNELEMPVDRARIIAWSAVAAEIARGDDVAIVATVDAAAHLRSLGALPEPSTLEVRGDLAIARFNRPTRARN